MGLIIVSGLSGAGKSVAMHALEDLGYYCVDNLPTALLNNFVEALGGSVRQTAVSLDARSGLDALSELPDRIRALRDAGEIKELIFLEAGDDMLVNRFSETRRKHPLSGAERSLAEALALERTMLEGVRDQANSVIDTTLINPHQLRELSVAESKTGVGGSMAVMFESFGFKYGIPRPPISCWMHGVSHPYWKPLAAIDRAR